MTSLGDLSESHSSATFKPISPMRSFDELTAALDPKEQAFVDAYLDCWSAAGAARRVWSTERAKRKGYEVLHRPDVAAAVEAGLREQCERTRNDPDRIIRELMVVAYADPIDLIDPQGRPYALRDLAPEIRRAIASLEIEVTRAGTRILKYKFVPKLPALELLGKRLKMFSDRLELDSGDSLAALIKKAFDRPRPVTKNGDQG